MGPRRVKTVGGTDYGGMTVNERLFAAGLMDEFDTAARKGDRAAMIKVLTTVELGDEAAGIADAVLSHPTRYGRFFGGK
jgi:hypothetical protein